MYIQFCPLLHCTLFLSFILYFFYSFIYFVRRDFYLINVNHLLTTQLFYCYVAYSLSLPWTGTNKTFLNLSCDTLLRCICIFMCDICTNDMSNMFLHVYCVYVHESFWCKLIFKECNVIVPTLSLLIKNLQTKCLNNLKILSYMPPWL